MKVDSSAFKMDIDGFDSDTITSFGVKDAGLIFDMLCTKLYSNPINTMVQEYMCNARDAHREVGVDNPIVVRLPTKFYDYLVIQDFGVGISEERMHQVFIYLGESTKRNDDDQTGGFGIGAKIAWAYTDSFEIVSIHGGVRREYIAFMGDTKVGQLMLVDTCETDEHPGVSIKIKIKPNDFNAVEEAVNRTSYFWDIQPEVINRRMNYEAADPFKRELEIRKIPYFYNNTIIVSDGIPYPIPDIRDYVPEFHDSVSSSYRNGSVFIFFCRVNEVDVAINRESVRWTKKTISTIRNMLVRHKAYITDFYKPLEDINTFTLNAAIIKARVSSSLLLGAEHSIIVIPDFLSVSFESNIRSYIKVAKILTNVTDVDIGCRYTSSVVHKYNVSLNSSNVSGINITDNTDDSRANFGNGMYYTNALQEGVAVCHIPDKFKGLNREGCLNTLKKIDAHQMVVYGISDLSLCEKLWSIGFLQIRNVKTVKSARDKVDYFFDGKRVIKHYYDKVRKNPDKYCYVTSEEQKSLLLRFSSSVDSFNCYDFVPKYRQCVVLIAYKKEHMDVINECSIPHLSELYNRTYSIMANVFYGEYNRKHNEYRKLFHEALHGNSAKFNLFVESFSYSNLKYSDKQLFQFVCFNLMNFDDPLFKKYLLLVLEYCTISNLRSFDNMKRFIAQTPRSVFKGGKVVRISRSIKYFIFLRDGLAEQVRALALELYHKYPVLRVIIDNNVIYSEPDLLSDVSTLINMRYDIHQKNSERKCHEDRIY